MTKMFNGLYVVKGVLFVAVRLFTEKTDEHTNRDSGNELSSEPNILHQYISFSLVG